MEGNALIPGKYVATSMTVIKRVAGASFKCNTICSIFSLRIFVCRRPSALGTPHASVAKIFLTSTSESSISNMYAPKPYCRGIELGFGAHVFTG